MTFNHRGTVEQIAAIVYHPEGPKNVLLPFSVFTVQWIDRSKLGHGYPPSSFSRSEYDFDWCKRDASLYYHYTGGGGENFYLNQMAFPKRKPLCAVWWDKSIVTPISDCSSRKLSLNGVKRRGFEILDAPLNVLESGANPFNNAIEDEVEWCSVCKDHLPTEELCRHIFWCDKCGDYSKPGERCKHGFKYA